MSESAPFQFSVRFDGNQHGLALIFGMVPVAGGDSGLQRHLPDALAAGRRRTADLPGSPQSPNEHGPGRALAASGLFAPAPQLVRASVLCGTISRICQRIISAARFAIPSFFVHYGGNRSTCMTSAEFGRQAPEERIDEQREPTTTTR